MSDSPSTSSSRELTPQQRALLALRALDSRDAAAPADDASDAIPRVDRPEPVAALPLSFAQQRLWFLAQLEPDSTAYNLPVAITLRGPLDVDCLAWSLDAVVDRHESLRTTFADRDGTAVQVIEPPASLPLSVVDLCGLADADRAAALDAVEHAASMRPFDLRTDWPLRVVLVRLAPQEHRLIVTMHHIASDAWSMEVLIREVATLYDAASQTDVRTAVGGDGAPDARTLAATTLPPLDVQYADFAAWQRDWMDGSDAERERAYWTGHLRDAPRMLNLPTDRPRPPVQAFDGDWEEMLLSESLTDAVYALAQRTGATPFMILKAAFAALMGRYARQTDVCIGTPTAGRQREEVESLIGFFVNTLVVRTDLSTAATFRDLLDQVRGTLLTAYDHQTLPFEHLVDALETERDPSRHPLFQVLFSFGRMTMGRLGSESAVTQLAFDADQTALSSGTSKFDLTFMFAESRDQLRGIVEYSTALFDASTIRHMIDAYVRLLSAAVYAPDRRLSALPLVGDAARHRLASTWNDTDAPLSSMSLASCFETQALATPDRVALVTRDAQTSYRAVNRCANALADRLRRRGVGPGQRVGLCTDRSTALVVGLLAILKTGAAYVPLDPTYPSDRLAVMVEDAAPQLVVTQTALRDATADWLDADRVVDVDAVLADRPDADATWDGVSVDAPAPDDLAYIVYTSGSTGRPKGVAITQRGICNELDWRRRTFPLDAGDGVLHNFSYSFDPSVWMFFWPWLAGGHVHLVPEARLADLPHLARTMATQPIAVLGGAPSMLDVLLNEPDLAHATALRHVFSGGEVLPADLVHRFYATTQATSDVRLHNVYGPTETVIDATYHTCGASEGERGSVPIGRPVDNKRLYVLDDAQQMVPVGMPGELCVGGVGLARGYWNRPRLTADRFIPNPYATTPGERLYRTGDLVRYRPDRRIEFLGRVDEQVKLRGYRIEPAELEALLVQHPDVREAAVVLRSESGRKQLVAYAARESDVDADALTPRDVRAYLKERTPAYMLPQRCVVLDDFPRTPSGKVDRAALPEPSSDRSDLDGAYRAPANDVEAVLCDVWRGVLGLDRVGVDDNFFELGGDSILSIQVIARALAAGVRITPRHIFQHQTIAELAPVADAVERTAARRGPVTGAVPLTPVQRAFLGRSLPDPHHANFSAFLRVPASLDVDALRTTVEALVAHHDALRARFTYTDAGWTQRFETEVASPLTVVDLGDVPDADRVASIETEADRAQRSLNLTSGPVFRAVYLRLGAHEPGRLLLVVHRLVTDGVSWGILQDDLRAFYTEAAAGREIRLPLKSTSIPEWMEHTADYAAEADVSYWTDRVASTPIPQLADATPPTEGDAVQTRWTLDADRTYTLLRVAPSAYRMNVDDVLMAAIGQGLYRWGGSGAAWVDREGHGRDVPIDDVDLSRTVGYLSTFHPEHIALEARTSHEALVNAHDTADAVPDRGVGFLLARTLGEGNTAAALRRIPDAPIALRYLGRLDTGAPKAHSDANVDADAFADAPESVGTERSPRNARGRWMTVDAYVRDGRLHLDTTTGPRHAASDVDALLAAIHDALVELVDHCASPDAGLDVTPDDFALADLDVSDLDRIAQLLDG